MPIRAQAMPEPWQVRFTNGGHTATADTHKNGVGGGAGLRPHELLEAALASCMTITARMALAEKGVDDTGLGLEVEVVRTETTTTFQYTLHLPAALEPHRDLVTAAVERSPVRMTLSKALSFEAK